MSETKAAYDPVTVPFQIPVKPVQADRPASVRPLYSTDSQITELLDAVNCESEDPITAGLCAGFLLLHKDLDRIATALEMRNRADTADRPLSRRLRAVNGGAKP